jgi:hypothetical protein
VDYSDRLDALQQRVAAAKTAVQTAATESRDQLHKRIDKAQGDVLDAIDARAQAGELAAVARA